MSSLASMLGVDPVQHPLRTAFLKWQCHARQMAMRDNLGRPDDAIMPHVYLDGDSDPLGQIITLLNKAPGYSQTPEMQHMAKKTNDPAQIREAAIRYLSATYYQKHKEFSDILTATFPAKSPGAASIRAAEKVRLVFDAYAQRFELQTRVWRLIAPNPLYSATIAHNVLFNPNMDPGTEVLGFEPDWDASKSEPDFGVR